MANLVGVFCPIIVCVYAVPWLLLVLLPLAFILWDIQAKYRPASRDLKRIGSVSLSPMYSHFADTVHGMATIRAMRSVVRFVRDNEDKVEAYQKASYAGQAAGQWLSVRLQLIGCAIVTGIATIAVIEHSVANPVSAGLVGLAISYALGITAKLSGLVTTFTETEREMVAVERVQQYVEDVPQEDLDAFTAASPYGWPSEAVVSFKAVNFRYRDHLPLALSGFDFESKACEKIGIVGRTGAGKSSVFHALFRTAEIDEGAGEIRIDGVNTKTLSLKELRRAMTVIPQDPVLFSGTLRENLDPLNEYSDDHLWDALRSCKLEEFISRQPQGILTELDPVSLSSGQRQLFCLARAILRKSTVI